MGPTESSADTAREPTGNDDDRLTAYGTASGKLQEWTGAALSLALLEAALSSGVLEAALEPRSAESIAGVTGIPESRVEDLCKALYAREVLDYADGLYWLTATLAPLLSRDAPQPLTTLLARQRVTERMLVNGMKGDAAYAELDSDDRLTMAKGASATPGSPLVAAARARAERNLPEELRAIYESGGRHLELGCGIGGAVLNTVLRYPTVTAVGVDREAALLAEADRQAQQLGVADRVEWRAMDARELDEQASFDTVAWSQFFFPAATRAATLEGVRRALRPGGYLSMPILPDPPTSHEGLRGPVGRQYTIARMIYGGWGVPVQSAAALQQEVAAAGFEIVGIVDMGHVRGLVARRPPD